MYPPEPARRTLGCPGGHGRAAELEQRNGAFVRDGPTVLSYAALGAYAFCLYAFGPALALLRSELHFSYALLGVYTSLWAGGAVLVGLTFSRVNRVYGRRRVLWASALGTAVGAVLFGAVRAVGLTMLAAAILGYAGTMLQTATVGVLSDRHGASSDRALVESNAGAGACAVVAPLALGLLGGTPAGWRSALALPVLALGALYLRYRRLPLAQPQAPQPRQTVQPGHTAQPQPAARSGSGRRLPRACLAYAWLVAAGIAAEFCVVYFGAELLLAHTRLSTAGAATAMSLFYAGILVGRLAGSGLTRAAGRARGLIWVSLAVTVAGLLAFWLSRTEAIALAGLLVAGLGVANLFPLSMALTLAAAPGQGDEANARTQLLGGLLVIAAPFSLGALADHVGLTAAFTVGPAVLTAAALLLLAGDRAARAAEAGPGRRAALADQAPEP